MTRSHQPIEEALISQVHQLRLQALQGSAGAATLAHEYELQLHVRLQQGVIGTADTTARSNRSTAASDEFMAMADATADAATTALGELLRNARELLEMDIAFIAASSDGCHVVRQVDRDTKQSSAPESDQADLLADNECRQRVEGRVPPTSSDTAALFEAHGSTVAPSPRIGSYLSTPVMLLDGQIYGTLCCISHHVRCALGSRQVDALRTVAALVSTEVEKIRRESVGH